MPSRLPAPGSAGSGEGETAVTSPGCGRGSRLRPVRRPGDLAAGDAATEPGPAGCRTSTWPSPEPSPRAVRSTIGSGNAIKRPGRLTLSTKLDLWQMLRPAVQPGSTTGYTLPDEEVIARVRRLRTDRGNDAGRESFAARQFEDGRYRVRFTVKPKERQPVPLEISLATGGQTTLDVSYTTQEDDRPRALPLWRSCCPGRPRAASRTAIAERHIPELKGGDWGRGRALFLR